MKMSYREHFIREMVGESICFCTTTFVFIIIFIVIPFGDIDSICEFISEYLLSRNNITSCAIILRIVNNKRLIDKII